MNDTAQPRIDTALQMVIVPRATLTAVDEALEVGDANLAYSIVDGLLEGGVIHNPKSRTPCPTGCGFHGWPGVVDDHLRRTHGSQELAT